MRLLSVECSATPCSVAVMEDKKVLASDFMNDKLTHSQTLMPMIERVLSKANLKIADIDRFAVSAGPGSFTGIRIGVSAIKGLAAPKDKLCCGVSTLLSMAYNFFDSDCYICAVMDARCNQVYNALFKIENKKVSRICEDRALMCEDLAKEIKLLSQSVEEDVIIVGDGAEVFYPFVENIQGVKKAGDEKKYQNAVSVAMAAEDGEFIKSQELLPIYLRLPQAERELKSKQKENKE